MKIAVIEDEKPIREGLVHILNKISPEYQVVGSAENGAEGLILLEEEMPDLIMLDIQMPDMDGLQMLKEARARGIYTKVIILTAYSDFSYAKKAIELGIENYLLKPVNLEMKSFVDDISITPLAIPMLCGPGAIANGIVLMEDAQNYIYKIVLIGVLALVFLITYWILRTSPRLFRFLGETGNNVMMRLMGLILMVIAVECFVSGVRPILIDIFREGIMK